jgi:class 3 adenylate cyclase
MTLRRQRGYAKARDGASIAYETIGNGPHPWLILESVVMSGSDSDGIHIPALEKWETRLRSFCREISFDYRGTGASDRGSQATRFSPERIIEDGIAVLDALGVERSAVFAEMDAGPIAVLMAATFPDRVSALVLSNTWASARWAPDHVFGVTDDVIEMMLEGLETYWGSGGGVDWIPTEADNPDLRDQLARIERRAASPSVMAERARTVVDLDVRHVLSSIQAPTLVFHRTELPIIDVAHAKELAERIPNARLIELPGQDMPLWPSNSALALDEIEAFLTGIRPEPEPNRVLATILFTDIVGSTELAHQMGDAKWQALLALHYAISEQEIQRSLGRLINTTGDGVVATFDGPARAIRCARALQERLAGEGIQVRIGIHIGEVELRGQDVGGVAFHIAARVMAQATAGEIMCTRTVKDLVVGSGITFENKGDHELKGVPEKWQLFSVTS